MKAAREGFTLVEVLVAMVMLAVILSMLGGLMFATARQAVVNSNASTRQALSLEMVNRLTTLPFNMLVDGTVCDTTGTPRNRYQRCATIAPGTAGSKDIVIRTTPLQHRAPASVTRVVRAAPPPSQNPLCTLGGC